MVESECESSVKSRKRAFKIYLKNPTSENYYSYKKRESATQSLIRQTKRDAWKHFCSSLDRTTPIKYIWSKLKMLKNSGWGMVGGFLNQICAHKVQRLPKNRFIMS